MAKSKPLTIRLDDADRQKLEELGTSLGHENVSQTVRAAVNAFLKGQHGAKVDVDLEGAIARVVWHALQKELKEGKRILVEDPQTNERVRLLISVYPPA